jgi:hypothetical protein
MKSIATSDDTMQVCGPQVPVDTPIPVYDYWNLVGYLPMVSDSIHHSLASIDPNYLFVMGYQGGPGGGAKTWDRARPPFLNDLMVLNPHWGFWIKMDGDGILTYPTSGYLGGAPLAKGIAPEEVQVTEDRVTATRFWCDLWGMDIAGLSVGDEILVKAENVVCGVATAREGGAFLVHVYGDDPETEIREGAVEGDELTVTVNGNRVIPGGEILWRFRGSQQVRFILTDQPEVPAQFTLEQNFPNPFNPSTTIRYQLPESGKVTIIVYNMMGQEIRRLVDEEALAGYYNVVWDGRDEFGRVAGSGLYLVRMQAKSFSHTRKILFLK